MTPENVQTIWCVMIVILLGLYCTVHYTALMQVVINTVNDFNRLHYIVPIQMIANTVNTMFLCRPMDET